MADRSQPTDEPCPGCRGEPEPGWIEMPNNGPIVPCWLCNREKWLEDPHPLNEVFP
jgi:hypothetical protein